MATFAGVTFLSRNELRPAKSLPKQAGPGPSTFRQVASRMGRVLWHLRVLGAGRAPTDNEYSLMHYEPLLRLWAVIGQQSEGAWDRRFEGDTKGITGLETSLEGRTANRQQVALGPCQECIRRLRVFAVDATPRTLGVVEFIRQGDTWKPVNEGVTIEIEKTQQGEAELEAALTAARTVVQEARGERCPHCGWPPGALIGGDADSARAALAKGYSCSQAFRNRMRTCTRVDECGSIRPGSGKDQHGRRAVTLPAFDRGRTPRVRGVPTRGISGP